MSLAPILGTSGQEYDPHKARIDTIAFIMLMFAMINVLWRLIEIINVPSADQRFLFYGVELAMAVAGTALMRPKLPWDPGERGTEFKVLWLGLLGGITIVAIQFSGIFVAGLLGVLPFDTYRAADIELGLLAPVAETLLFQFFIFGGLRSIPALRGVHWLFAAAPTSIMFALYHFFIIGTHPVLILIFTLGSIVLDYLFEKTQCAGTPMVAHFFNNLVPVLPVIAVAMVGYWWLLTLPIVIIIALMFFGGLKR